MLFKAHRCRSGPDIYNPAGPVLKTICRDPETHRSRDINPEDKVQSVWDDLHHEGTKFFYSKVPDHLDESDLTLRRVYDEPNKFPRSLFYNKADELEDEILFPEERAQKKLDLLDVGKVEPIRIWEEEGFSMRKFVEGWESDYTDDSDWDALNSDEEWEDEDDAEEDSIDGDKKMDNTEYDAKSDGKEATPGAVDIVRHMRFSNELREAMEKLMIKDKAPPKDRGSPAVMHAEFMAFLDKEKAKSMAE
jgi:hypothetical protein